jgi:MoaA/NifB/PqqE/SkfB family radical SAM enzyme
LLKSNLKILNVSLDAATSSTYRKIRGFDFEVVVRNIERVIAAKRQKGTIFPLVCINMTMMRTNIEEATDLVVLAANLGADQVALWHLNRWEKDQMALYLVHREGWVFDYEKEGLWNYPELSNTCIRSAEQEALRLGIKWCDDPNKSLYLSEASGVDDGNG